MDFFHLSEGKGKAQSGQGYFNCPQCGRRQRCSLYQVQARIYLWHFIPVSSGGPVGPESYRCLACLREFTADGSYGYDFGVHAEQQTWRCFKCKQDVAYERFDCPHCGYRLELGGR
jgi:DNA-directed RNA polymerase subunit RPC12/RpoP